jgi:hypothetical protein
MITEDPLVTIDKTLQVWGEEQVTAEEEVLHAQTMMTITVIMMMKTITMTTEDLLVTVDKALPQWIPTNNVELQVWVEEQVTVDEVPAHQDPATTGINSSLAINRGYSRQRLSVIDSLFLFPEFA